MAEELITADGFKKILDTHMEWTSKRDRPLSAWFLSLMDWAEGEFNKAYERENPKKR